MLTLKTGKAIVQVTGSLGESIAVLERGDAREVIARGDRAHCERVAYERAERLLSEEKASMLGV